MAKLARWQRTIQDDEGNVRPGAIVEFRSETTGNLPSLFSDRSGSTPKTNSFTADTEGFAFCYVEGGAYRITVTDGDYTAEWRHVAVGTAAEYDINEVTRWSFPFSASGLLGDGEELPAIPTPAAVTIPADCDGSVARAADGAPTGTVVVQFKYSTNGGASWSNAFTCTFSAGSRIGVFDLDDDLSLPAGALLRPVGPVTHDATFEGFAALIESIID